MLFSSMRCVSGGLLSLIVLGAMPAFAEFIERGAQIIDGTRVNTAVYHERGYAVFSNECGSQQISQSALQGGAKPTKIIPCPRNSTNKATESYDDAPSQTAPRKKRLWSAVAAGLNEGFLGIGASVGIGLGSDHPTRVAAERAAVNQCKKYVSSCSVVGAWNSGCYYITLSDGAENVAWGAGSTPQAAYDNCFSRVRGGGCRTDVLGGCYSE